MTHLTDAEISAALSTLPGWTREGQALVKAFTLAGFPDVVSALVRLAFEAEAADHHPDVTINYRRVRLSYTTHSEGALTQKDVEGARAAERTFGPAALVS